MLIPQTKFLVLLWAPELKFTIISEIASSEDFPGGAGCKKYACQCRRCKRHGFDSWVRKIPSIRKWHPTPVFLPEQFHGQRSMVCYTPCGYKEQNDWAHAHARAHTHTHTHTHTQIGKRANRRAPDICQGWRKRQVQRLAVFRGNTHNTHNYHSNVTFQVRFKANDDAASIALAIFYFPFLLHRKCSTCFQ